MSSPRAFPGAGTSSAGPIAAFATLDLTVRRRLDGLLSGDHEGLRLGPGSDPEEVARYQPGHDVRRIDWNATARSTEPQVWLTRAEHAFDTWVLLDATPSMAFGTAEVEKGDLAGWVSAIVGLLTDAPGNRVGVATLSVDTLNWSRPLAGRIAAHRAVAAARRVSPRASGSRSGPVKHQLGAAIEALSRRQRRPGLRVIISDFIDPDGQLERPFDWERAVRRMAARNDVVMVEVVDRRELTLPEVGVLTLVDPESGRQREVATTPKLRETYRRAAELHRAEVAAAIHSCGAAHVVLHTDSDWVADLARFVLARRRAPRAGRRSRRAAEPPRAGTVLSSPTPN
jgi:uncharacterized protein (DUF58 family)